MEYNKTIRLSGWKELVLMRLELDAWILASR